jgi:Glycosyl transferase family 2
MPYAPIALFVYNRPAHTRRTVAALQKNTLAKDSDLFVFSDAPKSIEAGAAVRQVRDYIAAIDGFKSVTVLARSENLGLARSIAKGVTQLIEERGRVIVLEDDLVTSPHFLEYMNAALDRYEGEDRVMQIAGYMYPATPKISEDALFLPFISSWGWATWRRAWAHFAWRDQDFAAVLDDPATTKRFDLDGHYKFSKSLRAQQQGKVDSWAIHWYLSVFLQRGLALFPKKTLVHNLGFDGTGVNCFVSKIDQDDLDLEFRVTQFPELIDVSPRAGDVIKNIPAARLSLPAVLNRVSRALQLRT